MMLLKMCYRTSFPTNGETESMARYPLNLPEQLKREAEQWAAVQGVSLNQFIMWAVAEKVGALGARLDDSSHPHVTYRRGAAGMPVPVVRGAGIRVQALVVAAQQWEWTPGRIAAEYGLSVLQVEDALAFYEAHRAEIDASIKAELELEKVHV
jgi:uncharacterized protein (DUF433 family)